MIFTIGDFSGGINKNKSKFALKDNQVVKATNMIIYPEASLTRRKGYTKVNTVATSDLLKITNAHINYQDGVSAYLVAGQTTTDGAFYKLVGSELTEITGGTSFNNSDNLNIYTFREYALFFDGESFDYSEDLSTKSACGFTGNTLKPRLLAASDKRLFVVDSRYPNSLFYSDFNGYSGSPADWQFPTNNEIEIPDHSADPSGITNILSVGPEDSLLIFRENDVWKLIGEGYSNYVLRKLISPGGCISPRGAAVTARGDVIFIGNGNIYEYDGERVSIIGQDIRDDIKDADLTSATAVYEPYYDIVIIGWEDKSLVWHCSTRSWTEFTFPMNTSERFIKSTEDNEIYFTHGSSIYHMFDSEQDDGEDIRWEVETRAYMVDSFYYLSTFRDCKFLVESTEEEPFNITVYSDGVTVRDCAATLKTIGGEWDVDKWDIMLWAGKANVAYLQGNVNNAIRQADHKGHFFIVNIQQEDDNPFTLHGIAINVQEPKGRKEQ